LKTGFAMADLKKRLHKRFIFSEKNAFRQKEYVNIS